MTVENAGQYGSVAKATHWIMAALVVAQFVVGWVMPEIERGTKPEFWINLHLSLGAALILFIVFRVVWRLTHRPPPMVSSMRPWEKWGAGITHTLLYVLLIVMPVTGWAAASVRGWPVTLFGLLRLPMLLPEGTKVGFEAGDVHCDILSWVLLALIGLHVLAALYHRFVRRDAVLARMMPTKSAPDQI